ncbi:MAG: BON domain-containing protein [Bdellovibrio sp.]|nr:BON domain-containing protein [Bdellovibrio sp.]
MKWIVVIVLLMIIAPTHFSACAKMKGETAGEYLDDSVITAKVNSIIVEDPDAQYFKIDVTTIQGDVVLQGFVPNREIEDSLMEKIKQIRGVKSVKSLLKVEKIE